MNENTDEVKFIDFEYADANYQAFDIANHFNEWAGKKNICIRMFNLINRI